MNLLDPMRGTLTLEMVAWEVSELISESVHERVENGGGCSLDITSNEPQSKEEQF